MGEFEERQNPYTILGLEKGFESTDAEIKKAFRKLALTKHPDKQPDNPNAAAEFGVIQRAYEILLDSAAREAWDQLAKAKRAREERHAGATAKRRKMTEDLEKRERAFQTGRNEEQVARNRLHAELERLRQQHKERDAQVNAERMAAATAATMASRPQAAGNSAPSSAGPSAVPFPVPAAAPDEGPPAMTEELVRTLKVSWDARDGGYTAEELRAVFSAHGPVSDVVMRQPKKKKKSTSSAFVEMGTLEAAAAAARAANGRSDLPLLVVPFSKVASVEEGVARSAPASPLHSAPNHATNGSRHAPHLQPQRPLFPAGTRAAPQPAKQSTFASFPSSFPAGQAASGPGRPGASNGAFGSFSASSFPGVPSSGGRAAHIFGSASRAYESETLMKLQKEAERKRLIAELEAKGELVDD
ncbi:DnaJ-domain-containing protein [Coccomyxa subellipsoidea C-169]|uniref:DnaJ-domain-containing protein n=1 Tax=Coccomyxa subellipsoidea (strain C-169) TaxID=574566 RepID=I0YWI5_COCSC|nr:DnaJ-domain-containing protein [Coccomyxa subellipsoidea C-169]EIE22754.1 DnaJ-domain-containing protein [Coccomyxa subellipsoidea C-169]|eukprot:XP_005647298.1 DnaJ-domain-containing protein [Coccomyxa subellipsoidea C-169]